MKILSLFLILLLNSQMASAKCQAILINGGADQSYNYNVHTSQLREMYNALRAQGCSENDIHVFSASGSATSPDFRIDPTDPNSRMVANPYRFNGSTQVPNLYPADAQTLKTEISRLAAGFKPEDKVFIYAADHGADSGKEKGLVTWSPNTRPYELFTPDDMEKALAKAPAATHIKLWTECCYCGAFNKMERPNTCVATSTDEYHEGSYNWSNWDQYAHLDISPNSLTSKTYFAGQVKKSAQTSLDSAARVSRSLTGDDQKIQAQTIEKGCFIGPRDSSEQLMFDALGYSYKPMCMKDLLKLTVQNEPPSAIASCDGRSGFKEIDNLRSFLDQLDQQQGVLNYSEHSRILDLKIKLDMMVTGLKNSPEYKRILSIKAQFEALTPQQKVSQAAKMQADVAWLKKKLIDKTGFFQVLLDEQKLVVEAIFLKNATASQKAKFFQRKKCLDEPLI
ncbi:MAG: C13 family peptidase [Pseudobdellovibrio sp.]